MKKKDHDSFVSLLSIILMFLFIVSYNTIARGSNKKSAQSTVKLSVIDRPGYRVPADFTGISFETDAILPDHRGVRGYFFSSSNKQLINIFINSGIRCLRIGGSTVDRYHEAAYDREAIDSVFSFAKAVGIKVIYSLPILNASDTAVAATAKYIWTHYRNLLDCFSIGNEPNCPPFKEAKTGAIKSYEEYLPIWRRFASTVVKAVPEAKFAGPDSGGWDWTGDFAREEKSSRLITFITHHQYPGGKPFIDNKNTPMPATQAIDNMLSPEWLAGEYSKIYSKTGEEVHPHGFRCRMTEANDYLGGIAGASNAMASTLWALDYMHWQAARGLIGINFHNNQWLKTCTVYMGSSGEYLANPKAHAIRAFDMVSNSYVEPVSVSNPENINLTAYALKGDNYLYVTIINKEHGPQDRSVQAVISAKEFTGGKAEAMFLIALGNDAGSTSGITLGGDSITNNRPWNGEWTAIKSPKNGNYRLKIDKTSAVIVRIPLRRN